MANAAAGLRRAGVAHLMSRGERSDRNGLCQSQVAGGGAQTYGVHAPGDPPPVLSGVPHGQRSRVDRDPDALALPRSQLDVLPPDETVRGLAVARWNGEI